MKNRKQMFLAFFAFLLLVAGNPLLFIITLVAFVLAFAKLGCLTQH